jgi:3-dehydroquinate synthase
MRGIGFGFVPTTLLAQVDAGVGGKNGVNFDGFKNIIGVFNQPEFVLIDFDFLKTLPAQELQCGIAEIIKHSLIKSKSLFDDLEKRSRELATLQSDILERAVTASRDQIRNRHCRHEGKEQETASEFRTHLRPCHRSFFRTQARGGGQPGDHLCLENFQG